MRKAIVPACARPWFSHGGTIGPGAGFPVSAFHSPRNVDSSPAKHPINGVGGLLFIAAATRADDGAVSDTAQAADIGIGETDDRAISAACWLPSLCGGLIIDGGLGKLGQAFVGFLLFGQGLVEQFRGLRIVELERPGLQGAVA